MYAQPVVALQRGIQPGQGGRPGHQVGRIAELQEAVGGHGVEQGILDLGAAGAGRKIVGRGVPLAPGTDEAGLHMRDHVRVGVEERLELGDVRQRLGKRGVLRVLVFGFAGRVVVDRPHQQFHAMGTRQRSAGIQLAEQAGGQGRAAIGVQAQHRVHDAVAIGIGVLQVGGRQFFQIRPGPAVKTALGVGKFGIGGAEAQADPGAAGRGSLRRRTA